MSFVKEFDNTVYFPEKETECSHTNCYLLTVQTSNNVLPKAVVFSREQRALLKWLSSELTILSVCVCVCEYIQWRKNIGNNY